MEYKISDYYLTWVHLILYQIIFWVSYYYTLFNSIFSYISAIILGWCVFAHLMIGHDAYHNALIPKQISHFKISNYDYDLNRMMVILCADSFGMYTTIWNEHKYHHQHINDDYDQMTLRGKYIIIEFMRCAFLMYISLSVWIVETIISPKISHIISRPLGMIFYYSISSMSILKFYLMVTTMGLCFGYLTFVTHLSVSMKNQHTIKYQLDNTYDIFRESHFWLFMCGAINVHATHHIYMDAPRSKLYELSLEIQKRHPDEYKCIDTWGQLFELLKSERQLDVVYDIRKLVIGRMINYNETIDET